MCVGESIFDKRGNGITYLERSSDERAKTFQQLFYGLDLAVNSDDNQQLAIALHSIVEVAKSSPFGDLANLDSVQNALDDPRHCWKF